MSTSTLWLGMGWTMLHFLWVGTVIGCLGGLALRAMRNAAPERRYVLALATLAMLALAPVGIAWQLQASGAETLAVAGPFAPAMGDPVLDRASWPGAGIPEQLTPPMTRAGGKGPVTAGWSLDPAAAWLPWLWVVGSPLTFCWLACGLMGAGRLRRRSHPVTDRAAAELCQRLALALGITRRVGLYACDRIAAPVLVGVLRPLILLPAATMAGWTAEQLEMVLLHELAHVRRLDNLVNLLQRLVESLLFFHPAVWIVSAWVRREREYCCDRVVVERTGRPRAYVETLLALTAPVPDPFPRMGLAMARGPLVGRVRRILEPAADRYPVRLPLSLLVPTGFLLLVPAGLALSHAQQAAATAEAGPASHPPKEDAAREPDPKQVADRALEVIRKVATTPGADREAIDALAEIASAQSQSGDREGALATFRLCLERIEDTSSLAGRGPLYRYVIQLISIAGETDLALELAAKQPEDTQGGHAPLRSELLKLISCHLGSSGNVDRARRVADRIEDVKQRGYARTMIARFQVDRGDPDAAWRTVDSIEDPRIRIRSLTGGWYEVDGWGLSGALNRRGDSAGARKALLRARMLAEKLPEADKLAALLDLAVAYARIGDIPAGLDRARSLSREPDRSNALGEIARLQAETGAWDDGLHTAREVTEKAVRARALRGIADAMTKAGRRAEALATYRKAIEANQERDAVELARIAEGQARAGDLDASRETLRGAGVADTWPTAEAAAIQAQSGEYRAAREMADRIEDLRSRSTAFATIAHLQAEAGHGTEALRWVDELNSPVIRARALMGLAHGLASRRKGATGTRP